MNSSEEANETAAKLPAIKRTEAGGKRALSPVTQEAPTLEQRVIYVSPEQRQLRALIVQVFDDGGVELFVEDPLRSEGRFHASPVYQDARHRPGTWYSAAEDL